MTDEALDALLKRAMDRAIERLQKLHSHAGRTAWDQVLREELSGPITTLRAQLAEVSHMLALSKLTIEAVLARAERAEAALAAPEVMHEDAPAAIVGEIGNQIHNLGCELQNDEDVSLRLSDLACRCWDAAKLFPTDRTALDRMIAQTREKALREAAEILDEEGWLGMSKHRILALIEKEKEK